LLSQIIHLLLEVVFGLLVGACLLRLYMLLMKVPFRGGSNPVAHFVVAVSDWLVLPIRKLLPQAARSISGVDVSCAVAALLLSFAHQALRWFLVGPAAMAPDALGMIFLLALFDLLRLALSGLMVLLIVHVILSWFGQGSPMATILRLLCEPLLRPIRRIVPLVGGIDLSPLVAIVFLQIAQIVLMNGERAMVARFY
jgi:YggT family protein